MDDASRRLSLNGAEELQRILETDAEAGDTWRQTRQSRARPFCFNCSALAASREPFVVIHTCSMSKESVNCSHLPRTIKPMLAQARAEPFNCDKHLFEVKWDGIRCLSFIEDGRLRLQNRHLIDISDRYPELACLRELPAGTVIDGEIVVLEHGRPSFQKLQQRDHLLDPTRIEILSKRMPVTLMAFDLLYVRGRRITGQPLTERCQRLIDLVGRLSHPLVIAPDYIVGHGIEFFTGIVRHKLEGMMAKRIDSPYLIGKRSSDWLKVKVVETAEFEVIGCVPMRGEKAIRVLLLGGVANWVPKMIPLLQLPKYLQISANIWPNTS